MSKRYHIICITCDDICRFDDMNRRLDGIKVLIQHKKEIGNLIELEKDTSIYSLELKIGEHNKVDIEWFSKHARHNLKPIDEYGKIYDTLMCGMCGNTSKDLGIIKYKENQLHAVLCAECAGKLFANLPDPRIDID